MTTLQERKERANSELEMMKKKNKPIPEAKDAKEVAKKLIRSGAIAAIQVVRKPCISHAKE